MVRTSLLSRLLGPRDDGLGAVRPLWHRVVELARAPAWYAHGHIADSVAGRFDAITLVLALVMLRIERAPGLGEAAARLTELFVTDMDGQLRETGVGDLVVGKHVGRLVGALGGRLGALREALGGGEDSGGDGAVAAVVARNVTLADGADGGCAVIAAMIVALADELAGLSDAALIAAAIPQPASWADGGR